MVCGRSFFFKKNFLLLIGEDYFLLNSIFDCCVVFDNLFGLVYEDF